MTSTRFSHTGSSLSPQGLTFPRFLCLMSLGCPRVQSGAAIIPNLEDIDLRESE